MKVAANDSGTLKRQLQLDENERDPLNVNLHEQHRITFPFSTFIIITKPKKVSENRWKLSMIRHKFVTRVSQKKTFKVQLLTKVLPFHPLPLIHSRTIHVQSRKPRSSELLLPQTQRFRMIGVKFWMTSARLALIEINDTREANVITLFKLNMSPALKRIHLHNLPIRSSW